MLPTCCADIKLDSGFKDFFHYCKSQGIPLIIVSRYGRSKCVRTLEVNTDPFTRHITVGWSRSSTPCSPTSLAKRRVISTSYPTLWTFTRTARGISSSDIPPGERAFPSWCTFLSISAVDMVTTSPKQSSHIGTSQTLPCSFSSEMAFQVRVFYPFEFL